MGSVGVVCMVGALVGCSPRPIAPTAALPPKPSANPSATGGTSSELNSAGSDAEAVQGVAGAELRPVALPTSYAELAERGFAAIRGGNVDKLMALFVTAVADRCPELRQHAGLERMQEARDIVGKRIAECSEIIDWPHALLVERKISTNERSLNFCDNSAYGIDDIYFYVEVGDERFAIKLDDPMRIGDAYVFADDPKCRRVTKP
jgi:hypothetical protein